MPIVMPDENGWRTPRSVFVIWLGLSNIFSKAGTIYQGKLSMKPTPNNNDPHIKMKTERNTVLLIDLPPRNKFLWNILENQRATEVANTAFIKEATNMSKIARGDAVR